MADDEEEQPAAGTYKVRGMPWGIAEDERIFLSIRPDEDGSLVRRGFDYVFVTNPDDPDATLDITLHHQRRAKVVFDDDLPSKTLGDRAMAAIAYAVTLELTSEIVGFATTPAARRIGERMLVWTKPTPRP